jgi:DNA-binding winged helix-turn-helix (wHTH) protein
MGQSYRFAEIEVRPDACQVLVGGRPAALHAKAFDLLVALVERRDRVVPRAELYDGWSRGCQPYLRASQF